MELSYSELIHYSVKLLNDYENLDHLSFEQFIEDRFKDDKYLDDIDYTFILEVLSGCVKYSKLLEVVINKFLMTEGKNSLVNEIYTFKVFEYLIMFRIDELTVENFLKFVSSVKSKHLMDFLRYLMDEGNILNEFKKLWCSVYDDQFIEIQIALPLLNCQSLRSALQAKPREIQKPKIEKKKIITKPFNLTPVKPRKIVSATEPVLPPPACLHCPIPATVYVPDDGAQQLKEIKKMNWQKAMALHSEMSLMAPTCAVRPIKSEKTLKKLEMLKAAEEQKYNTKVKRKPYLPPNIEPVPIKLNTTAILREGRVYQKKEEEFLKKLEDLEFGGGDLHSYEERKEKLKFEDEMKRIEDQQLNVLMGKLSKEEAIVAKKRIIAENKDKADALREEAARMMQEYMLQKLQEDDENRLAIEKIQNVQEDMRLAKKKMIAYKTGIVQRMQEDYKELMRVALEEAEQEMQKRLDLITEIREMESNRSVFMKTVDPTATGGHMLLGEMSVFELKERLKMIKEEEQELWQDRNADIQNNKQLKNQMLQTIVTKISHHRTEQSLAAIKKSQKKFEMMQEFRQNVNPNILQAQMRLDELKAQRFADENKNRNNATSIGRSSNEYKLTSKNKSAINKNINQSFDGRENLNESSVHNSRVALLAL